MDSNKFNEIINNRIKTIQDLLVTKNQEYAGKQVDRLHNFNKGAEMAGKRAVEVLMGYKLKHTVSLADIVDEVIAGEEVSRGKFLEKLSDEITYLLLLECVMEESGQLREPKYV